MKCKRCGKCCRPPNIIHTGWWRSEPEYLELSKQQIQKLEAEQAKYPDYPDYCEMLIFEGDLAVCLIEKTLGFKPKSCQDYWCKEKKDEQERQNTSHREFSEGCGNKTAATKIL